MVTHGSATAREETPHAINISNSLKRRAQSVIDDKSIDARSRTLIRYGLETNDPWLRELVRRIDAGETIIDSINFSQTPTVGEDVSIEERIETLAEMIGGVDNEPGIRWAALLLLMATVENGAHPKVLANTAKHLAFTRCGELNVYGIVDALLAVLEGELLVGL